MACSVIGRRTMNGSLYDDGAVSSAAGGGVNRTSLDGGTQLSPPAQSASSVGGGSGPLHIPAKRLTSVNGGANGGGGTNYPQGGQVDGATLDSSSASSGAVGGVSGTGLLRHHHHPASQPWSYADSHAAASVPPSAFDPQYSPSLVRDGMAAAAAAAYYGATDRAKSLSFWPSDYGKYSAAAAAAAAAPSALPTSAESVQFNAGAWCGYAGYGSRVPEPHGAHSLGPAPGQGPMGVPVSVAGYLAAEAHEVRRGAMDAAAAAACFPHDGYAGLRGYAPPDGMPPSVYGPGQSRTCSFHYSFI